MIIKALINMPEKEDFRNCIAVYDTDKTPVMLILAEDEKRLISEMGEQRHFCSFPDECDRQFIDKFMRYGEAEIAERINKKETESDQWPTTIIDRWLKDWIAAAHIDQALYTVSYGPPITITIITAKPGWLVGLHGDLIKAFNARIASELDPNAVVVMIKEATGGVVAR